MPRGLLLVVLLHVNAKLNFVLKFLTAINLKIVIFYYKNILKFYYLYL